VVVPGADDGLLLPGPVDWVLHVDLDQFLAAVEVRRRPELAGKPVVVGGDGDPSRPRQVVATASYEARAFGVRSGMPLRQALRRCPDAVFLPSDRPAYDAASEEVMASLRSFGLAVEVLGWDEAFMAAHTTEPEALAQQVRARVLADSGLTCAVGIGETKLQAKTATGFAKPGGIARLTRTTWLPTMGQRPVTAVWGIGERIARRLAELGIQTVDDLARADHHELARRFGPRIGPFLRVLGLGGDDSAGVGEPHVARSRSREATFTRDVTARAEIEAHVARLGREVTESVVAEGRRVTHVAVKVRTATFFTRTKISKLPAPTTGSDEVAGRALDVLARFELDRPVRLLGVRAVLEDPGAGRDSGQTARMIPDHHRDFVRRSRLCVLSWNRADTSEAPPMTPVFYVTDGDDVLVSITEGRAKTRALRRDPAISVCVLGEEMPFSYVTLFGTARIEQEGALEVMARVLETIGRTLDDDGRAKLRERAVREQRVVLRVTPARSVSNLPEPS
jgi:DNA polymerase-4